MRNSLLLTLVFFAAVSCIDQKDYSINSADISPSMAVPLAFGTLTIQDLLSSKDSMNIKVYSDDLVYLEYSHQLISRDIRDLFNIPDKAINQSFVIPSGNIPAHNHDIRSDSVVEVFDFGLSPEQLTEIDFKTGTISYSANWLPGNPTPPGYQVLLTSSNFTSRTTNQPLSIVVNGSGTIPLSDYNVTLNNNKFNLKMVLVLKQTNTVTHIGSNTSVAVNFGMSGMDFNSIKGFFGDQTVNPPSALLEIGAFGSTLNSASVSFAQPMVSLIVVNDYGVPCKVSFSKIEARKDGSSLALQLNPASPILIAEPAALGMSASTPVTVTNAKPVIDFGPTQFFYQMSARINPGVGSGSDFLADTSKLRVNLHVELPIYGHGSGIILRDTAAIDLSKVSQSDVKQASLRIDATNELPLNAKIQLYLADAQNVLIDSLLDSSQTDLIQGSTVSSSGDLETAGITSKAIPLNQDKLSKLFSAKNLIIVAKLSTSKDSNGNVLDVKFKSQYTLKINAGLLANLNFNVKF